MTLRFGEPFYQETNEVSLSQCTVESTVSKWYDGVVTKLYDAGETGNSRIDAEVAWEGVDAGGSDFVEDNEDDTENSSDEMSC